MRRCVLSVLLLALFLSLQTHAQSISPSTVPSAPATPASITIGESTVPLTGPWKFHTGDNPAWASPAFDDSSWGRMDLTPSGVDPNLGSGGFVPGWTARGYAGYSGYAWYRLRVNVTQQNAQGANEALAIALPADLDDAYQVYANGRLIGHFGRFTAHGVTPYMIDQPRAFSIPRNLRSGVPLTIAIRMWMDASTPLLRQDAGGLHGPPILGQSGIISALQRLHWDTRHRFEASNYFEIAVQVLAILVVFTLLWLDRDERAYLWLGLICTIALVYIVIATINDNTTWISESSFIQPLIFAIMPQVQEGLWLLFWGYWFRLERIPHMVWLYRVVWGAVLLRAAGASMLQWSIYGVIVPAHAGAWIGPILSVLGVLLGLILAWITYQGIRKNEAEGWIALPAVILVALVLNAHWLHIPTGFVVSGIDIPFARIATLTSLAIITVLMLRRFLQGQQERARIRAEFQQARSVQEMLIPQHSVQVPGFDIESVYLPASEVGGDFFQVLPAADGSLLIVVGDVSGKGLKAAMTVSAIIGALRNEKERQPAKVLSNLNRVLHGQITGFATCAAALIAPEGEVILSNAGNLAPYRNGEELPVDSGLPLGIIAESDYSETSHYLNPGDRLTFVSDGVVEAMNEKKELFGFDRTQAISAQPATAIAAAAQQFGQQDDISVLSVARKRETERETPFHRTSAIQEA